MDTVVSFKISDFKSSKKKKKKKPMYTEKNLKIGIYCTVND